MSQEPILVEFRNRTQLHHVHITLLSEQLYSWMHVFLHTYTTYKLVISFIIIDAIPDSEPPDTLAGLLSRVLSGYNGHLNNFVTGETLQQFAQNLYGNKIITSGLNDDPTYDEIEKQFTALLKYLGTKDKIEVRCKDFLYALCSQGGPLIAVSNGLRDEWRVRANADLQVHLCLNTLTPPF